MLHESILSEFVTFCINLSNFCSYFAKNLWNYFTFCSHLTAIYCFIWCGIIGDIILAVMDCFWYFLPFILQGWNHRGVYILSRDKILATKVKRKLSPGAHRRMRMDYHRLAKQKGSNFTKLTFHAIFFMKIRTVNTTVCEAEDYFNNSRLRWHPHRKIVPGQVRAPLHPYMSEKHRRNLNILD